MVKVNKCCCCIPVKTGAYIIGCFHVLGVIIGIVQLDIVKIVMDIFCGTTFLFMVFRDSEWNRLFYLATYMAYTGIVIATHLIFFFWDRDEELETTE